MAICICRVDGLQNEGERPWQNQKPKSSEICAAGVGSERNLRAQNPDRTFPTPIVVGEPNTPESPTSNKYLAFHGHNMDSGDELPPFTLQTPAT